MAEPLDKQNKDRLHKHPRNVFPTFGLCAIYLFIYFFLSAAGKLLKCGFPANSDCVVIDAQGQAKNIRHADVNDLACV